MILPISAQFADGFSTLRAVLEESYGSLWVSAFSRNPAALFSAGLGVRSTIVVGSYAGDAGVNVTKTHRWVRRVPSRSLRDPQVPAARQPSGRQRMDPAHEPGPRPTSSAGS